MHVINYELPSMGQGGIDEYVHRIGRTGRIGHRGIATSFYNDRNADFAPELVKLMKETDQEIPDFLQQYDEEAMGMQADEEVAGVTLNNGDDAANDVGWGSNHANGFAAEASTAASAWE